METRRKLAIQKVLKIAFWLIFLYFMLFNARPFALIYSGIRSFEADTKSIELLPVRPIACFLKDLSGWSTEDVKIASRNSLWENLEIGESNTAETNNKIMNAGKIIYERHAAEFDSLLKRYDSIIREPVKKYDLLNGNKTKNEADKGDRDIIRAIETVSYFFSCDGRGEDAVKLLILNYKYSLIRGNGEGYMPDVIDCMRMCQFANTYIGGYIFSNAIYQANLGPKQYENFAADIKIIALDIPDFAITIESAIADVSRSAELMIERIGSRLFAYDLNLVRKQTAVMINELRQESLNSFKNNAKNAYGFSGYMDRYVVNLVTLFRQKGYFDELSDPYRWLSEYFVIYSVPSFYSVYTRHYLKFKMLAVAVPFMLRVLAAHFEKNRWPKDIAEAALMIGETAPVDLFSTNSASPLILKVKDGKVLLYSVGGNAADDGGIFDLDQKDVLLFKY